MIKKSFVIHDVYLSTRNGKDTEALLICNCEYTAVDDAGSFRNVQQVLVPLTEKQARKIAGKNVKSLKIIIE